MKVILRKDVLKLGSAGDVKQVKTGFGRNFLIPRGLAEMATPGAMKSWKATEEQRKKKSAKEIDAAKEIAKKLSGMSLSFNRPAGEEGKLFGSVGKSDIVKSLKASGLEIDKEAIQMPSAIKTVGDAEVEIVLKPGVSSKIKVSVSARSK